MERNRTANIHRPECWKEDSWESVDFYNNWYIGFAPRTFRNSKEGILKNVCEAIALTNNFCHITPDVLERNPKILSVLRMITAPPLAQERLSGLAHASKELVKAIESGRLPRRVQDLATQMERILSVIVQMTDYDIFPWMHGTIAQPEQLFRSASIVADRLCSTLSDPVIRNEQEHRQLSAISTFLKGYGYEFINASSISTVKDMPDKTFCYHLNIMGEIGMSHSVRIPIDVVIMRPRAIYGDLPMLVECKSAGDFTNTNKRRKEEAAKVAQLRNALGKSVQFILFLCGYFDAGYLGYEAAEGIDWVWEHRISDFELLGI